jgi:hypothetical protein
VRGPDPTRVDQSIGRRRPSACGSDRASKACCADQRQHRRYLPGGGGRRRPRRFGQIVESAPDRPGRQGRRAELRKAVAGVRRQHGEEGVITRGLKPTPSTMPSMSLTLRCIRQPPRSMVLSLLPSFLFPIFYLHILTSPPLPYIITFYSILKLILHPSFFNLIPISFSTPSQLLLIPLPSSHFFTHPFLTFLIFSYINPI